MTAGSAEPRRQWHPETVAEGLVRYRSFNWSGQAFLATRVASATLLARPVADRVEVVLLLAVGGPSVQVCAVLVGHDPLDALANASGVVPGWTHLLAVVPNDVGLTMPALRALQTRLGSAGDATAPTAAPVPERVAAEVDEVAELIQDLLARLP